jgi:hypothetical protein
VVVVVIGTMVDVDKVFALVFSLILIQKDKKGTWSKTENRKIFRKDEVHEAVLGKFLTI